MIYTDDFFSPTSNYPMDDLVSLIDSHTFENVNFKKTAYWYDGSLMDDSKLDSFIYRKKDNTYYVDTEFTANNSFNIKKIGLKADGQADDTLPLQKAIDIAIKLRAKLKLPGGVIKIINQISIDISQTNNLKSYEIEGAGIGVTIIKSENNNECNTAIYFKGMNEFQFVKMKGFSIVRPDIGISNGGTGLKFEKAVYVELEDIDAFRFSNGIEFNDVALGMLTRVNARWCKTALKGSMQPGGFTPPNLINFVSCGFHSNSVSGVYLENCHNVKFDSCGFEGNSGNPLDIVFNAANGTVGLNAINNYFEGNKGEADIKITNLREGVHNITGNTFNRLSNDHHTYYNILVAAEAQGNQVLNMTGNGFLAGNSFIPEAGKPAWHIPWNSESFEITDFNYYSDEVLRPSLNLKNIIKLKKEYNTGRLSINADGTYTNGTNGLTSMRYSQGIYLITLPHTINTIQSLQITAQQGDASITTLPSFGYGILSNNTLQILCRDKNGAIDNGFLFNIEYK
ncbi:hypothetical protein MP477_08810 [Chryseobacterium sp. WG23]|uniref:hypothetical protein n=1 Tax=Chryseobacterium sp. WG23 TaxID=2926910 RepID=UPI00211DE14A|nr:hypothetical protein [Chryseobacterium sp. WG23]MCQ9635051.1 hypothetical protein [Chryseobacterium sp. WG23]